MHDSPHWFAGGAAPAGGETPTSIPHGRQPYPGVAQWQSERPGRITTAPPHARRFDSCPLGSFTAVEQQ